MKTHINNRLREKGMRYILFLVVVICLGSATATYSTNNELIRYEFETGTGSIIYDTSGYDYHGLMVGGAWSSTQKKFGAFSVYLDRALNAQILTSQSSDVPNNMTVTLYYWAEDDNNKYTFWDIYTSTKTHLSLKYDVDNGICLNDRFCFEYVGTDNLTHYVNLGTNKLIKQQWHSVTLTIQNDNTLKFYRNATLIQTTALSPAIIDDIAPHYLKIGGEREGVTEFYDGYIDNFRIFNTVLNTSQLSEVFAGTLNISGIDYTGHAPAENETPVIITPALLINSTTPASNQSQYNPVNFEVVLNYASDCEVYINSNLEHTFYNRIAFTFDEVLSLGDNYYFMYCSYVENSTMYYEITPTIHFTVLPLPDNEINFYLLEADDSVTANWDNLYIVTPCFPSISKHWKLEPDESYYVQQVGTDKVASFSLTPDTYEFCLYNGRITYDKNDFTSTVSKNEIIGYTKMGEYFIPNNVTQEYTLYVGNTDLYPPYSPSFYGLMLTAFLKLVLIGGLGFLVVFVGMRENNGKAIFGGAVLIAISVGYSLGGLIFGLL